VGVERLDPKAAKQHRSTKVRKIALWVVAASVALIVLVSLLPNPPAKPAPAGAFARILATDWGAPGVTAAVAFEIPGGEQIPMSEIRQPGNHASLRVYVWTSSSDPIRAVAKDIQGVLSWEIAGTSALPMATDFEIGSGASPTFDAQGDKVYLAIAYTRHAVQGNSSIWSGHKNADSPQFTAPIFNSASEVAVIQGRAQVKRFCSNAPAAVRFCQLAQKNLAFQDGLGH
jgi:hypothetical protein